MQGIPIRLNSNLVRTAFISIITSLYAVNCLIITPYLNLYLSSQVIALYTVLYITVVVNYLLASLTPSYTQPRVSSFLKTNPFDKKCDRCVENHSSVKNSFIKPQRAHHCSFCQKCVHRMDHHCPVVQNCIGQANHKSFATLLIVGVLSTSLSILELVWALFLYVPTIKKVEIKNAVFFMLTIVYTLVLFALWLSCTVLGYENVKYFLRNSTTIDSLGEFANGNNFGVISNLRSFFGSFWRAFLPCNFLNAYEGYHHKRKDTDYEYQTHKLAEFDWKESLLDQNMEYTPIDLIKLMEQDQEETVEDRPVVFVFGRNKFS